MPTSFVVNNQAELDAALRQIDLAGASSQASTAYTISLARNITLTSDLYAIDLAAGDSLSLQGNGHTLNGGGKYLGIFDDVGSVAISNLAIDDTRAAGSRQGRPAPGRSASRSPAPRPCWSARATRPPAPSSASAPARPSTSPASAWRPRPRWAPATC